MVYREGKGESGEKREILEWLRIVKGSLTFRPCKRTSGPNTATHLSDTAETEVTRGTLADEKPGFSRDWLLAIA